MKVEFEISIDLEEKLTSCFNGEKKREREEEKMKKGREEKKEE